MSKCKQGEEEEYGPGMEAPPIIDSLFIKVHTQSISSFAIVSGQYKEIISAQILQIMNRQLF
jgi:hypothetical protein